MQLCHLAFSPVLMNTHAKPFEYEHVQSIVHDSLYAALWCLQTQCFEHTFYQKQ